MTSTLALIGKSGSGKTTLTKAFCDVIKKYHPQSSILLVDNDLTCELAGRFGLKTHSTIYGIRSGKHEYKTGIPEGMSKQEFIEWALEDIILNVDENVDLIVSWLVPSKDCRCPITYQMQTALQKLISGYDFVIFDCEFDLKYLNQLVDFPIDSALIVTNDNIESLHLADEIYEFSKKYATEGQLSVILNKTTGSKTQEALEQIQGQGLDFVGFIENLDSSDAILESAENIYPRLNLPQ